MRRRFSMTFVDVATRFERAAFAVTLDGLTAFSAKATKVQREKRRTGNELRGCAHSSKRRLQKFVYKGIGPVKKTRAPFGHCGD